MSSPITSFSGKVAVVTGGASGIGRALCEALLTADADVVIADVEKKALDRAIDEVAAPPGRELVAVVTDVTDFESVRSLADQVYERFGRTNLLFNNAGVGAPAAKVWETTPNDWRWVHAVNVNGVIFGIQAFVPRMIASGEPGYVINTTSGDGGITPMPTASAYAASKAAVSILTECLGVQLEEVGANVAASLFFPSGKGLLATGMWTSDRNRPARWGREVPRPTEPLTIESLKEQAAKAGRGLPLQPLDELADAVLDGIVAGRFVITLGPVDGMANTLRQRADRFGKTENPVGGAEGHGLPLAT
ncbi:MAG TPA: SDR family NAD(P)-dependent oxidoreductase [Acidimicrobiales bacterium]